MPKPNEDQVVVNKLVLDKVLLAVDAEGYVDLLDPVRVRTLVGMLPEGVKYWLLGADGECPKLCEGEHFSSEERGEPATPEPKPRAVRKPRNAVNEAAQAKDEEKPSDEDLEAVRELLSEQLIDIAKVAACAGWPDTPEGYARAGAALCHLRDVTREAESVDGAEVGKPLMFRLGRGTRVRQTRESGDLAIEPGGTEAPLFASEADVLGAMLASKPQTVAQIAAHLELGVARVAPTIDALVAAGKVERAAMKGRYPQFQKVAA